MLDNLMQNERFLKTLRITYLAMMVIWLPFSALYALLIGSFVETAPTTYGMILINCMRLLIIILPQGILVYSFRYLGDLISQQEKPLLPRKLKMFLPFFAIIFFLILTIFSDALDHILPNL